MQPVGRPVGEGGLMQQGTGMEVAVQHFATSKSQQLLCTIARVCRSWRLSVQQAGTRTLDIKLTLPYDPNKTDQQPVSTKRIVGFGSWLPKYAVVVNSITIGGHGFSFGWDHEINSWCNNVAGPVLALALKAASATRAPLQLRSYHSSMLHDSAVLQALPGVNLTRLVLERCEMGAVALALAGLPNLQVLQLEFIHGKSAPQLMNCLSQLTMLTGLQLSSVEEFNTRHLPMQLRQLHLEYDIQRGHLTDAVIPTLSHLTGLTQLDMAYEKVFTSKVILPQDSSTFPRELLELSIRTPGYSSAVIVDFRLTALQSLQRLIINSCNESEDELLFLNTLPQLGHLALVYNYISSLGNNATSAWRSLHQLRSLCLDALTPDVSELQGLLGNLTQVTWLTQLSLGVTVHPDDGVNEQQVISICGQLAGLAQLQELCLYCEPGDRCVTFVSGDAHHLSALTTLTKVVLGGEGAHINDAAVVAVVLRLTHLVWLETIVETATVLPVLGQLTSLRHLSIYRLPTGEQQSGLHYLTGLKQLTHLGGLQPSVEADFWAAMHASPV